MFKSGIFISGTKIEIIDSGYGLLAGSTGYVVGPASTPNGGVFTVTLLITKRGKSGQLRLESKRAVVPVFYFEGTDKKVEEYYKALGGIGAKLIRLKEVEEPISLLEVPTIDFLGWCSAKLVNLSTVQGSYIDIKGAYWKEEPGRLEELKRLPTRFSKKGPEMLKLYDNVDERIISLTLVRNVQATVFRLVKAAEARKRQMYYGSANYLFKIKKAHKYKFSSFKDLSDIKKIFLVGGQ